MHKKATHEIKFFDILGKFYCGTSVNTRCSAQVSTRITAVVYPLLSMITLEVNDSCLANHISSCKIYKMCGQLLYVTTMVQI